MGLDDDRGSIFVFSNVVALHPAPVAPLEGNGGRPRVDFENLPGEIGHHVAECVVAVFETAVLGTIVFIWGDYGRVCSSEFQ